MLPTTSDMREVNVSAERSAYAKVDLRILLPITICFILAYIDRVNVGFAYLHMKVDVGLDDAAFGLGVGLFFISYVLFEVPSNLLLMRVGARKTISRIMILWGLASSATMFVQTPMQFYIARMVLGAAEAGFFPGSILILTYWYPAHKRARAMSLYALSVPISGIVGSPLSGWIMHTFKDVGTFKDWQWLFMIEGILPAIVGVAMYFLLTDSPAKAKWLTTAERDVITTALQAEQKAKGFADDTHRFSAAIRSPRLYILALVYFPVAWVGNILNYWGPVLLKQVAGSGLLNIGFMLSVPPLIGAIGMLLICRSSDKHLERRWHWVASAALIVVGALSLSAVGNNLALSLMALSLMTIGYLGISILFFTFPTAFLSGSAAAGGLALVSAIGQIGGFLAPVTIGNLRKMTGSFSPGLYLIVALLIGASLILIYLVPASSLKREVELA